jgi:uncharacterized protein YqgQ
MTNQIQVQPQPQQQADSLVLPLSVLGAVTLGVIGFLAKWAFNQIFNQSQRQIDDLRAEIKELKTSQVMVREEYVTKEEFLRVTVRFEEHMDRLGGKIDRLLEK